MIELYEDKSYWSKCYKKCLDYRKSIGWDILVNKVKMFITRFRFKIYKIFIIQEINFNYLYL